MKHGWDDADVWVRFAGAAYDRCYIRRMPGIETFEGARMRYNLAKFLFRLMRKR